MHNEPYEETERKKLILIYVSLIMVIEMPSHVRHRA